MNLFSKEKGNVYKLVNGVLLIWTIIAVVVLFYNVVCLVIQEPKLTYDEYRAVNCVDDEMTVPSEDSCKLEYQSQDVFARSEDYVYYRSIIVCLFQILVVGGTIVFLNEEFHGKKKKGTKKKITKKN